jgi:hypothetical protein
VTTPLEAARGVAESLGGDVAAAYVIGSVALGGFEAGSSDLDMVVVLRRPLGRVELASLAEAVRQVDVAPARGLELVVYEGGEVVLNVNTGPGMTEHVGYAGDDPAFWFVLDRAIAQQHAVALSGPPWEQMFEPVSRAEVLDALAESLDWHAEAEPATRNAALNAVRTWRWLETGDWVTKPEAAAWLLAEIRARIDRERRDR